MHDHCLMQEISSPLGEPSNLFLKFTSFDWISKVKT